MNHDVLVRLDKQCNYIFLSLSHLACSMLDVISNLDNSTKVKLLQGEKGEIYERCDVGTENFNFWPERKMRK